MSTLTKILVVLNLVFSVALAFSGLVYFSHAHNYRKLRTDEQEKVRELEGRLDREKAAYQASREILLRQNDSLNAALDLERTQWMQLSTKCADLDQQLERERASASATRGQMELLHQHLLAANVERREAQQKAGQAQGDLLEARQREQMAVEAAGDLEAQRRTLQRNLVSMEREFQAQARSLEERNLIIARIKEQYPDADVKGVVPRIRGTVMAVDENTGVVVLNVGAAGQVKAGYEFSVVRGDKYVGRVRVIDVSPDWSGAVHVQDMMKDSVRIGDQVATVIE